MKLQSARFCVDRATSANQLLSWDTILMELLFTGQRHAIPNLSVDVFYVARQMRNTLVLGVKEKPSSPNGKAAPLHGEDRGSIPLLGTICHTKIASIRNISPRIGRRLEHRSVIESGAPDATCRTSHKGRSARSADLERSRRETKSDRRAEW